MKATSVDRHKHESHTPPDDAVVTCGKNVGRVISISESGMNVNWIADPWIGDTPLSGDGTVRFLCGSRDVFIEDLPVRFLSMSNEQDASVNAIKIKSMWCSFSYSDTTQHDQIKEYIFKFISSLSTG